MEIIRYVTEAPPRDFRLMRMLDAMRGPGSMEEAAAAKRQFNLSCWYTISEVADAFGFPSEDACREWLTRGYSVLSNEAPTRGMVHRLDVADLLAARPKDPAPPQLTSTDPRFAFFQPSTV